jgi:uncharacterized membrane protein
MPLRGCLVCADAVRDPGARRSVEGRRPADVKRPAESRRTRRPPGLDTPLESRRAVLPTPQVDPEAFGRGSERFARFMGTAQFIAGMTVFVAVWLAWNTFAPGDAQFDPRSLNYTLLTLILSLQASYAAPLILLAQNRQADRDRVQFEQDRQRSERNLADTEYLAREVAALRIALRDVATRDFLRSELRDLLEELVESRDGASEGAASGKPAKPGGKKGKGGSARLRPASEVAGSGVTASDASASRASAPGAAVTDAVLPDLTPGEPSTPDRPESNY